MMALEEKELKIFSKYFPIHDDTQYASGPLHIPVDMMDVSG